MIPPNATCNSDRVMFLADCGPQVGGGHVMRCLSLAAALARRGAACAFVSTPAAAAVLDAFSDASVARLPAPAAAPRELAEAAARAADRWSPGVVVIDHYGLAAAEETGLRGAGRRIAVIDDLADRRHDCDLLVDATVGREPDAYAGLVPSGARVLAGAGYALLRPEYAEARSAVLARRRPGLAPRRLLVSLGLTDVGGVTGRVLQIVRPLLGELQVDVVVGSGASSLPRLERAAGEDRRISLHVDSREMPRMIADADIAIGAGGSSTWERAALGLPSLSLILADNQRDLAWELDRRGAALALDTRDPGFAQALAEAFRRLVEEGGLRTRLCETSAGLCDGSGAVRAAAAILALVADRKA